MRGSPVHNGIAKNVLSDNGTGKPDLANPDSAAADLADKLRTAQMNFMFSKAVVFVGKWVIRPFIWWPIKYTVLGLAKVMLFGIRGEQPWTEDDERQHNRNNSPHLYP